MDDQQQDISEPKRCKVCGKDPGEDGLCPNCHKCSECCDCKRGEPK